MEETKTFKGLWWLPDDEDNKVPGTLIVEKSKIVLETIGFWGVDNPISHLVKESAICYDVVLGISSEAKSISVFNCHESMSLNTSCPFPIAKYHAQIIAVGEHIRSLDTLGNYDVKAYFKELSYWFSPNCLHTCYEDKKHIFYTDANQANHIAVPIEDNCNLELDGDARISCTNTGMRVEIEQFSTLSFVYSKPISIQEAKRKVFVFEQFLSFATLTSVQCDRLFLIDKDKRHDPTKNCTIEIFDKKETQTNSPEHFWKYLFVYKTIEASFPAIICKWYAEKDLFPIRAHLIDSVKQRGVWSSNVFLIVVQAVEGFYCRFREDGHSLTEILKNLRTEFSDITIVEMSDGDIDCIRDSRNYYSHLLPPEKKQHVVDGLELYYLNHKLRKLLLCCILKFVGFSNQEINAIFSKSSNDYLRKIGDNN